MNCIVIENVRSAYNVWNIIRTADALWWNVILSWFTPSPDSPEWWEKVKKTSLWSEKAVNLKTYRNTKEAISILQQEEYKLICWEISKESNSVLTYRGVWEKIALVVWNENTWVTRETLDCTEICLHVPMKGIKESLNVGQASAILMWELSRKDESGIV